VRGDDELQIGFTGFDQPCQVDRQLDQMVVIQRADRIINEHVLQVVECVSGPFSVSAMFSSAINCSSNALKTLQMKLLSSPLEILMLGSCSLLPRSNEKLTDEKSWLKCGVNLSLV
jgi:hypothetical protein